MSATDESSNSFSTIVITFVFGWVLMAFSIILIWVIEKQAVKFMLIMGRCEVSTRLVEDGLPSPIHENRAICVQGRTLVKPTYSVESDSDTNFRVEKKNEERFVCRLRRTVEVFQWREECEKDKDGRKTYTYTKKWIELDIDSSSFAHSFDHRNPKRQPAVYSVTRDASQIHLVGFMLAPEQVIKLVAFSPCDIVSTSSSSSNQSMSVQKDLDTGLSYMVYNGSVYDPQPGTLRIKYETVMDGGDVTTVGVQKGSSFRAFTNRDAHRVGPPLLSRMFPSCCSNNNSRSTCSRGGDIEENSSSIENDRDGGNEGCDDASEGPRGCCFCCACIAFLAPLLASGVIGDSVLLVEERHTTLANMFMDERNKFYMRLWLIRLVGTLLLFISFLCIFSPFSYIFSFIPLLGSLVSNFFWLVSLLLGITLASIVMSLAWVVYHPEILTLIMTTLGFVLWKFGESTLAIHWGQGLCAFACLPAVLFVANKIEDARYARYQQLLDQRPLTETARLLSKA